MTTPAQSDQLAYFRGWKDACNDVADFLTKLGKNAPPELSVFSSSFIEIANSVRAKGETALAMAEATQEKTQ